MRLFATTLSNYLSNAMRFYLLLFFCLSLGDYSAVCADDTQRPNILFIMTDQQFADAMSCRMGDLRPQMQGRMVRTDRYKYCVYEYGMQCESLVDMIDDPLESKNNAYWQHAFGKRPAEQLFDVADDPDCVKNLIGESPHVKTAAQLRDKLMAELKRQNDPRVAGKAISSTAIRQ